jgi:hypothetical protein
LGKRRPYAFFFHPLPLLAVALMFLNDHFLKYQFPGFITGKLSDFLGVFYFPLLLSVLFLMILKFKDPESRFSAPILLAMILITDVVFVLAKVTPSGNHIVTSVLDIFVKSDLKQDPSDLLALLMNPVTYFFGKSFIIKQ